MHRQNAKINSTQLGMHGQALTSTLDLVVGENVHQGFGGHRLFAPGMPEAKDSTSKWLVGLLSALELERWEDLKGTLVRIESERPNGPIIRIGHYLKDRWFDLRTFEVSTS